MSENSKLFLLILILGATPVYGFSQQFESSVYMNYRLIEDKDVTVLDSIRFEGWSILEVYDRRIPAYTPMELAIYHVSWMNGDSMEVHVLKEFFEDKSIEEVQEESVFPFAYKTGQLPHFLLEGIDRLVLFKGKERCSAALGSIYIHVEDHDDKTSNFVEEMLLHEGGHASMDEKLKELPEWKTAQEKDSIAVSTYASDNIDTEDLTESLTAWLAVRYRHKRVPSSDSLKIVETMPERLAFFDGLNLNVYPLDEETDFNHLYEISRDNEDSLDYENMISFEEFVFKAGLVMLGIVVILVVRYVVRNERF